MIGGNKTAVISTRVCVKNEIGEAEEKWMYFTELTGYLDLLTGDSKLTTFNAKLQESDHIFISDYQKLDCDPDNCRLEIDGKTYMVTVIDDPMELHKHLEIYLKFVG